jgi:hypothetical protein
MMRASPLAAWGCVLLLLALWAIHSAFADAPSGARIVLFTIGAAKISLGAFLGYWADRAIFPYSRPHELDDPFDQHVAMLRRALIVCFAMLSFAVMP